MSNKYNAYDVAYLSDSVKINRGFSGDQLTEDNFTGLYSVDWKEYLALCDKVCHALFMSTHNNVHPGYRLEDVAYELGRMFGLSSAKVYTVGAPLRLSAVLHKKQIVRTEDLKEARKERAEAKKERGIYVAKMDAGERLTDEEFVKYQAACERVGKAEAEVDRLEKISGSQTIEHKILWDKNFHATKPGRKAIEDFMADLLAETENMTEEEEERARIQLKAYNEALKKNAERLERARLKNRNS